MGLKDVTDVEEGTSTSSQRKYVQPSLEEMDEFFEERGESWEVADDTSQEYCVETPDFAPSHNGIVLRCYTTIDKRTGKARDKGADAIRLVVWDKHEDHPIAGREKTLRIKTWRKNIGDKIDDLMSRGEELVTFCDKCGSRMVLREGKYGKFYGCVKYPECDGTKDYDE